MAKGAKIFIDVSTFLLILLWVYAAISKLEDFTHFKFEMRKQVLPEVVKPMLPYLLPAIEIITALLLLYPRTLTAGYRVSLLLLSLFTGYILMIILDFFPNRPCSCGGILVHMSWKEHLLFNCLYLILTIISMYLLKRERKEVTLNSIV